MTRFLRWVPFGVLAGLSLWVAHGGTGPRKPFGIDFSLTPETLGESLAKGPHYKATALLFALAWLGAGMRRPLTAFALTLAIGVGWELAETTAARHHARLADLAPDILGALLCLGAAMAVRRRLPVAGREAPP